MANATIVDASGKVTSGTVISPGQPGSSAAGSGGVGIYPVAPGFQRRPEQLDQVTQSMSDIVYSDFQPSGDSRHTYFLETAGTASLSLRDTNVVSAGMIPFSERFLVRGLGAYVIPLVRNIGLLADYTNLNRVLDGSFSLKVNNKIYEQGPIGLIASFNVECEGQIDSSSAQLFLANPFFKAKGFWALANNFELLPGTPFSMDVEWDTAPDADQPWTLYMVMFGERLRMAV